MITPDFFRQNFVRDGRQTAVIRNRHSLASIHSSRKYISGMHVVQPIQPRTKGFARSFHKRKTAKKHARMA